MNLLEHYKIMEANRVTLVKKQELETKAIEERIKAKTAQKHALEAEKAKKEKLKAEVQKEGVDASIIDAKIGELDREIAGVGSELAGLQDKLAHRTSPPKSNLERAKLLTSVLKNYRCEEAEQVCEMDECWTRFPAEITELDEAGRPIECSIELGKGAEMRLKIKSGRSYFAKGFRPDVLRWLPTHQDANKLNGHHEARLEAPLVYAFLDKNGRAILSQTQMSWYEERGSQNGHYGRRQALERVEVNDDFADIAESLERECAKIVDRENGELDLDKEYDGNRLMQHLRDFVRAQTTTEPPFEPLNDAIPSVEIYKLIKPHWDGLANCPWSAGIRGNLALLKYHIENGERARFWVEGFKNHYGFRLRTRDHSWIQGYIYLSADSESGSGKPSLKIHETTSDRTWVAKIGNMWLGVDEPRDR